MYLYGLLALHVLIQEQGGRTLAPPKLQGYQKAGVRVTICVFFRIFNSQNEVSLPLFPICAPE